MVEIEVRGFQSIEQVHLKVDRFTTLVGRTNIGKSAIVRAVRSALTNALGTSFVRHGATCLRRTKGRKTCKCEAYVHIHSEGFDLIWRKGDDVNAYEFNGKSMTVPGRGFPEFLSPQFAPVKMGENQKILQVSDQFFPLFLLDEGGATVANILSDVARLDAINVAMKMAEKDRKDAAALRKVRDKDVETIKVRLQAYAGLDDTLADAEDVSLGYTHLLRKEQVCGTVTTLCTRLSTLQGDLAALDGVQQVVVPDVAPLSAAASTCSRVGRMCDRLAEYVRAYKALEGSASIVVPDIAPVRSAQTRLGLASRFAAQHADRSAFVSALDGIDTVAVPDVAPLREKLSAWGSASTFQERLVEQARICKALDGVDTIVVPEVGDQPDRGRTLASMAGWIVRLREFKVWFDGCKAADAAVVPEAAPLKESASTLAKATTLARRYESLTAAIAQIEHQHEVVGVEHSTAQTALKDFIADASRRGLLCPACTQPLHGDHKSHTETADEPHQLPV